MALPPITNKPLQAIAQQNPVQNSRIAQGLQAARQTSLQQAVASSPTVSNPAASQALGAQQAAQAGQIRTQQAAQTAEQQAQIGKQALGEQAGKAALEAQKRQLSMKVRADQLAQKLYQVDKGLKNKLLDESISFEKDEMGRNLFNERQLMDYKIASTKSDIELQKYEQSVSQMSARRIQMLQTALNKIKQTESQQQETTQQTLSQAQMQRMAQAKIALEKKIRDEMARRKNRAAMFGAAGAVVGGVAGAVFGGPAGAVAGSSLGSGLGSVAASQEEGAK
jgi:hypothetical protein